MAELTTEEIARAYTRVLRGSQLTSDTAKAVLTMAARYLELRERTTKLAEQWETDSDTSPETASLWRAACDLRTLLTPDAEEEPHR